MPGNINPPQRGPAAKEPGPPAPTTLATKKPKHPGPGPGRPADGQIAPLQLEELRQHPLGKSATSANMPGQAVWDGTNENIHTNSNDDPGLNHPQEPWKNTTKCVKTVTASIRHLQTIFQKEHKRLLNREDFAEALSIRGALRSIITIQISSSENFVSIEFATQQLMERTP